MNYLSSSQIFDAVITKTGQRPRKLKVETAREMFNDFLYCGSEESPKVPAINLFQIGYDYDVMQLHFRDQGTGSYTFFFKLNV